MITNLNQKAMLVSLRISMWTARRYDKKVSAEVAAKHLTSENIGRYHKRLIGEADSYEKVRKVMSEARDFHYTQTLPWSNDGSRILPSANYMTYASGMRKLEVDFTSAVNAFVSEYPTLRSEARILLNGLYNPEDYPPQEDMESRFSFSLSVLPMPDADDFRVNLADTEISLIRQQITGEVQSATEKAMKDLWTRLYDSVSAMADRLKEPDAIFRDSLVRNVQDICKLLPALNLANDTNLASLQRQVESELTVVHPTTLREDKGVRADVAAKAQAIQSTMASYMR